MKKLILKLTLLFAVITVVLLWQHPAQAADWIHIDQLGHVPVTEVVVNPSNHLEVAALAGDLWLSHDGGLTWRDQPFPAGLPTSVAYDPAHPGVLAVGTYNTCLMESRNGGLTWSQHRIPFNYYCNVQGVVGTKAGFIFNVQQVIGYTTHLFRLGNDEGLVNISSFSDSHPGAMAYDEGENQLCIGTTQELYCSTNDAVSWVRLAAANQIGNSPHNILIHAGEPWLLSDKGVFVYRQNAWSAQIPNNPISSGNPLSGLVVKGSSIIYGINNPSGGDVDIFTSIAPQSTGLYRHIFDIAPAGDDLFAATSDGLYVTRDLVQSEAAIHRPVIVIPGITGSLPGPKNLGALELDPITHTYDPLIARLRAVGYVDDKTLFPFPYDWRVPNEDTAELLKEQIAQVKAICGCAKVDIVAHSMGGLVARSYIQGQDYADDINKLIEVGTPNAGSVAAYYTWEGGELYSGANPYDRMKNDLLSGMFHLEALTKGYLNFTQYIRERVTTTQELLPIFNYINGRSYPDGYPRNSFLDQLDSQAGIQLLKGRVKLRIIGGDTLDTLKQLSLGAAGSELSWPDGSVQSVAFGPGDGTVLTGSLVSLGKADDFENASHGELTTVAQDTIVRYLLEDDVDQHYLDSIPDQLAKQQAVQAAETEANAKKYQILYAIGSGSAAVNDPGFYSGTSASEHIFSKPNPGSDTKQIHFVASGDGAVVFGGILIDSGVNGEPLSGQVSADLAAGDSVDVRYDPVTQEVTVGPVNHALPESLSSQDINISMGSGDAGESDRPGGSVISDDTELKPATEVTYVSASKAAASEASGLSKNPSKVSFTGGSTVPSVSSAFTRTAHFIKLDSSLVRVDWQSFGLDFWMAIAAVIALMLALMAWEIQKRL